MSTAPDKSQGGSIGELPTDCPLAMRYRRLLRLLPAAYRDMYAAEMTDVFLADARDRDPANADLTFRLGGPGWKETRAVLALALRVRWADPDAPTRYREQAAGLRLFTLAGLSVLAVTSAALVVGAIIFAIDPAVDMAGRSARQVLFPSGDGFEMLRRWAHLGWIAALVLAARIGPRRLRAAVGFAAIPVLALAVQVVEQIARYGLTDLWRPAAWLIVELAVLTGLAAMAAAAPIDNRPPSPDNMRHWLAAAGLVAVAWIGALFALWIIQPPASALYALMLLTGEQGIWTFATLAAVGTLLLHRSALPGGIAARCYGLAWLAAAAGLLQAVAVPDWITQAREHTPGAAAGLTIASIALAATTITAAASLIAAARSDSQTSE